MEICIEVNSHFLAGAEKYKQQSYTRDHTIGRQGCRQRGLKSLKFLRFILSRNIAVHCILRGEYPAYMHLTTSISQPPPSLLQTCLHPWTVPFIQYTALKPSCVVNISVMSRVGRVKAYTQASPWIIDNVHPVPVQS